MWLSVNTTTSLMSARHATMAKQRMENDSLNHFSQHSLVDYVLYVMPLLGSPSHMM